LEEVREFVRPSTSAAHGIDAVVEPASVWERRGGEGKEKKYYRNEE
jgi:hypothetical protein